MPERTCVCCREKGEKEKFFRFGSQSGENILDEEQKIQSRGFYVCKNIKCLERLSKHKKYNINSEIIFKMANELINKRKNILDIIKPMINSNFFVYGIDENIDGIKKDKVKLVILPKDIKLKYIEEFKKLVKIKNIKLIFINEKKELINIFNRDVNVVGIFDKKVVNGILNKVEVTDEDI